MSIEKRERRTAAAPREQVLRAPRPGGRVAEQRTARNERVSTDGDNGTKALRGTGTRTTTGRGTAGGARPGRRTTDAPVAGTAALRLEQPVEALAETPAPRLRVAPPMPVSVPRAPFVALVVVVVIAGVLGILMINTKTNQNTFKLSTLQQQQADLNGKQQELEQRIAEHRSAGSLLAMARKYGLVDSGTPATIRLPDGKVYGVPKPPDAAPAITSQQGTGQ
jgi:hypothetical protein